jgi:hypothetical protein
MVRLKLEDTVAVYSMKASAFRLETHHADEMQLTEPVTL